jgi:hypothetical protein
MGKKIACFVGFLIGVIIRWTFLIVFFLMNEELVSKYKNWKRKGMRVASILLVLTVFCTFFEPLSFTMDYCITWLILIKDFRTKKTLENPLK